MAVCPFPVLLSMDLAAAASAFAFLYVASHCDFQSVTSADFFSTH